MIGYLKKEKLIEPGSDKVIVSGKIERKIFENIEMDPQEKEQLKNLKLALVNFAPLRLPKEWQDSDYLRILAYCDYEIFSTIQVLNEHLSWRNKINLSHIPNDVVVYFYLIQKLNGAVYIHGHDKNFRPIIIINLLKALKYNLQDFRNGFDYLFNMLIRDVLISYYVESIIILIDMGNLMQLPHLLTNELMDFLKSCEYNYYGRIHKIYIIEEIYNCLFNRLIQILKPESQDKIIFLQKKDLSQLTNQIEQNQLETKFLGFQNEVQTNFWPPKNLSPEKIVKKDRKEEVKTILSNTDENGSKSQRILQRNRNESIQSSQLFLQVYNEEQEVVLSESHLIEYADSFSNIVEDPPDSQFQISYQNYYKGIDSTPLQSTTIKPKDFQRSESENWSSSELQMSSNLVIQRQRRNPCCQSSSTCQLI
ncbi:unnamed protein product [Paramecium octaurelia]|uniref:CRAL-TRIO domain-containing protein n=1 Tax=Paramecium octaurelia TaxID=43137 RepID=A0A8S1T226_PAROT|nr:unnamed protein product [Paramecium octaurelia]